MIGGMNWWNWKWNWPIRLYQKVNSNSNSGLFKIFNSNSNSTQFDSIPIQFQFRFELTPALFPIVFPWICLEFLVQSCVSLYGICAFYNMYKAILPSTVGAVSIQDVMGGSRLTDSSLFRPDGKMYFNLLVQTDIALRWNSFLRSYGLTLEIKWNYLV